MGIINIFACVIVAQCAIIVFQQIYFMVQIHQLINKLMSGSFIEYRKALAPTSSVEKIKLPEGAPEDLRSLEELNLI